MLSNVETLANPKIHRWNREEYYCMADAGLFQHQRVELIQGQVVDMSPMGHRHAIGVGLMADALRALLISNFHVREQMPFIIDDLSEIEPDIAIVTGQRRDYLNSHPTEAVLIVEVSDSTLTYDRKIKGSLYAKAGILDYWILNLIDAQLEVYRDPRPDPKSDSGYYFDSSIVLNQDNYAQPLALTDLSVCVADILP